MKKNSIDSRGNIYFFNDQHSHEEKKSNLLMDKLEAKEKKAAAFLHGLSNIVLSMTFIISIIICISAGVRGGFTPTLYNDTVERIKTMNPVPMLNGQISKLKPFETLELVGKKLSEVE